MEATQDRAWTTVPASAGPDKVVMVLLDVEDFEALNGRSLSIGSHGYAQMWNPPQGVMLLHRWIMNIPVGTGYSIIVDHINHDILDCRRSNLRRVTPTESNMNRKIASRDLPLGVHRSPSGRYNVKLKRNRVTANLGTFDTVEEARAVAEVAFNNPEMIRIKAASKPPQRISLEQAEEIRRKYASGDYSQQQIATEYGIDRSYVGYIARGRARRRPES